jgi:hypothetical protein
METVTRCLCCVMPIEVDTLCERCLKLVSEVVLNEQGAVVAKLWAVGGEFEKNRSKVRRQAEGPRFVPNLAVGTAFGFVRMGITDDGICLAALCVRHGADTCWECIAPGQVLTDPTAFYYESLDELRSLIGVTVR